MIRPKTADDDDDNNDQEDNHLRRCLLEYPCYRLSSCIVVEDLFQMTFNHSIGMQSFQMIDDIVFLFVLISDHLMPRTHTYHPLKSIVNYIMAAIDHVCTLNLISQAQELGKCPSINALVFKILLVI